MHKEAHELAGKTVRVNPVNEHQLLVAGAEFRIEDYWDRVNDGVSWMFSNGNPAALNYAARSVGLPIDDEVLYGKVGSLGYLVHISEIEE